MRVARYFLIGIAALVALVVVLLLTVDLGRFKTTVENLATESLGRELTIGGEFHVNVGRRIYLLAEGVKLADADWTGNETMASVGAWRPRLTQCHCFPRQCSLNHWL